MEAYSYFYIFHLFFMKALNRRGVPLEAEHGMRCLAGLCTGSSYLPAESLGEEEMPTNPTL